MAEYLIQDTTLTEIANAIRTKKNFILPEEYNELSFIGTKHSDHVFSIDTGYKPTSNNLKIEIEFMFNNININDALFGSGNASDNQWSLVPIINNSNKLCFYAGSSSQLGSLTVIPSQIYNLIIQTNNNILYYDLNGVSENIPYNGDIFKENNIYLFTSNGAYTNNLTSNIKIYSFKIYDNEKLVRYLTPCLYNTGSYGFYDFIKQNFYLANPAICEHGMPQMRDRKIPTISMANEILSIESGVDVSNVTTIASDVRSGKIFINSSGEEEEGLLTLYSSSGFAPFFTTTSDDYIYDLGTNKYTNRPIVVKDPNLNPYNIKSGVSIFGITGSYIPTFS